MSSKKRNMKKLIFRKKGEEKNIQTIKRGTH